MYVYVFVCVPVCVRGEGEKEKQGKRSCLNKRSYFNAFQFTTVSNSSNHMMPSWLQSLHFLPQLDNHRWLLWVSLVPCGLPEVLGFISKNVLLCSSTQMLSSLPLLCHGDNIR